MYPKQKSGTGVECRAHQCLCVGFLLQFFCSCSETHKLRESGCLWVLSVESSTLSPQHLPGLGGVWPPWGAGRGLGSLGLTAPCLRAALESLTSGLLPSLFLQQALPSVLPQRGLHVAEAGEAVHGPRRQSCWRESPEEGASAAWGCGSRHPTAPSSPAFPPARAGSLKS